MLDWLKSIFDDQRPHVESARRPEQLIPQENSTNMAVHEPPFEPLPQESKAEAIRMLLRTLHSMDSNEAIEQLVKQIKRFNPTHDLTVSIVLDTSFLMLKKMPDVWDKMNSWSQHGLTVRFLIPDIVIDEVVRHFGTDKDEPARIARKRIAQLTERLASIESLREVTPEDQFDAMSADSVTDRRIIAFAKKLGDSNENVCVLVATDDGGIMYDVARHRRAGARLASLSKESSTDDIIDFVFSWLGRSSQNDAFLRLISGAAVQCE